MRPPPSLLASTLCCLALIASLPAFGDDGLRRVTGRGVAADCGQARRLALSDAVQQAVGVFLTSDTLVRNFRLVRSEILEYSAGYVDDFTVREERSDGHGTCSIVIDAVVADTRVRHALLALSLPVLSIPGERLLARRQTQRARLDAARAMVASVLARMDKELFFAVPLRLRARDHPDTRVTIEAAIAMQALYLSELFDVMVPLFDRRLLPGSLPFTRRMMVAAAHMRKARRRLKRVTGSDAELDLIDRDGWFGLIDRDGRVRRAGALPGLVTARVSERIQSVLRSRFEIVVELHDETDHIYATRRLRLVEPMGRLLRDSPPRIEIGPYGRLGFYKNLTIYQSPLPFTRAGGWRGHNPYACSRRFYRVCRRFVGLFAPWLAKPISITVDLLDTELGRLRRVSLRLVNAPPA